MGPAPDGTKPPQVLKLEQALRGRFELGPFYDRLEPFFPHACISHACLAWAVNSLMSTLGYFCNQLGVPRLEVEQATRNFKP